MEMPELRRSILFGFRPHDALRHKAKKQWIVRWAEDISADSEVPPLVTALCLGISKVIEFEHIEVPWCAALQQLRQYRLYRLYKSVRGRVEEHDKQLLSYLKAHVEKDTPHASILDTFLHEGPQFIKLRSRFSHRNNITCMCKEGKVFDTLVEVFGLGAIGFLRPDPAWV